MRTPRPNARVYLSLIGVGPWKCVFCHTTVLRIGLKRWDGNVHHLDEDPFNNDEDNLAVVHVICHRRHHGVSDTARDRISESLRGRPSPTKGMKFSPEVNAKKARFGSLNGMHGKSPSQHARDTIREMNKKRVLCHTCGREISMRWITRHQQNGCKPSRMIQINGVQRVRGVEPKLMCDICDKPYAQRWMIRHKIEGRCVIVS